MGATPIIIKYPLDLTGSASSNAIVNESHTVPRDNSRGFALDYGAFYSKSLVIRKASTGETLIPHVDYIALHQYQEATLIAGQEICAAVLITNETIAEELLVSYQVVGGGFSSCVSVIQELVEALELDNRVVAWGDIIGKLEAFPAAPHYHDVDDFYGFEYMVAALDRIESAIMHGDYYDHELLRQRIANLRVELQQAIDDQAESQTLHLADFANPHKVNKAQVGLGNVSNFGTATTADATAGTSSSLFMTPAAVFAAIVSKAGSMLEAHSSREDNPHNTTKTQVGLGLVQNYAIASQAEAVAGSATDKYMTPYLTKQAIEALAGGLISSHVSRTDNPHNTTAAQVGLGSVDNFATASQAEAQATGATSTLPLNKFMTVRRVAEMIDARGGTQLTAHISNTSNPHGVTAAQVGLGNVQNYGIATSADVTAGQTTGTASNTVYITALRLVEYVANRLGNVQNYGIASQAEAEVIDTGSSSNAKYMTPLRVLQAINKRVYNDFANHVNKSLSTNPHGTTQSDVGLGNVSNYAVASQAEAQAMSDSASNSKYMTPWLVYRALITHLGRTDAASVLTTAVNHINNTNNPHGTTAVQVGLGNVANYAVASQVDAETGSSNGAYMTPLRTFQAIARYLANVGWSTVTAHLSRTDNPHSTTAVQVGLGNVQNYAVASQVDAETGSSNGAYMTPLRTFQAIAKYLANAGWSTVVAHLSRTDNPHSTTAVQVGLGNVQNFGIASQADAEGLSSNTTYITPWSLYKALVKFTGLTNTSEVLSQTWFHLTHYNNPHQVSKDQVGLSLVKNYPPALAGNVMLEGPWTNRTDAMYMTPYKTWQAIYWLLDQLQTRWQATVPKGTWYYLTGSGGLGDSSYLISVSWHRTDNGANAYSYYNGSVMFGMVSGRANPQFTTKEYTLNGAGSYGSEACKMQVRADGIYIYCTGGFNNGAGISNYDVRVMVQDMESRNVLFQ